MSSTAYGDIILYRNINMSNESKKSTKEHRNGTESDISDTMEYLDWSCIRDNSTNAFTAHLKKYKSHIYIQQIGEIT